MLIPTTCLFVLSLTIAPPFQLPCRGCLLPDSSLLLHIPAFVYGYRLLCRPFGRHRHLLGRSAPSPVPKRLSPLLYLLFLFPVFVFFLLSTICFAILYALRPPERTPGSERSERYEVRSFIDPASRSTQIRTGVTTLSPSWVISTRFSSPFFLTHFLPPHLPRNAYRHYTKYLRICPFLRIDFTDIS